MLELLKQKLTYKKLISILIVISSLIWLSIVYFPDQKFHLVFCDVGQGDATLISKNSSQILIDGGPNDKVLQCLANNMLFFDRKIEAVVLTHPEADHLTGLLSVLDKYQVEVFLVGAEGNNSALFEKFSEKLRAKSEESQLKIKNVYTGETIKVGDIALQTLWPQREWVAKRLNNEQRTINNAKDNVLGATTTTKLNQFSLVFLLSYKSHQVLLMGDADSTIQDEIQSVISNSPAFAEASAGKQLAISGIDILKFPHHGSKTGMAENFLGEIKPKEAVISVGRNSYGHPTMEALDLLKKFNVVIRRTDIEGEIQYIY